MEREGDAKIERRMDGGGRQEWIELVARPSRFRIQTPADRGAAHLAQNICRINAVC